MLRDTLGVLRSFAPRSGWAASAEREGDARERAMTMQYVGVAWRVLAILVGVYLLLVLLAWIFQRQLLYFPDRSAPPAPPGVDEVRYTTEDDLELSGWFLTPETGQPPYATV